MMLDSSTEENSTANRDFDPIIVETDSRHITRIGWLIVLLGFFGFLLWSMLAPLDKGVAVSGTVTKESNRKAVQHQSGGIIKEILVKEGDIVKAGQVLVRMDPTLARAAFDVARNQYLSALAAESRLAAEAEGQEAVHFSEILEKQRHDPRTVALMRLQNQLLDARQGAIRNELAGIDESIAGLEVLILGLQESRDSRKEQAAIVSEQLVSMRELARAGYIARTRLLDLERTSAEVSGDLAADIGNLGRAKSQVAELKLRKAQRIQDYQKEVRSLLTDARQEVETQKARLRAQEFELLNVEVKAPVDGNILGVAVFTQGGVVPSGFRMMDVVPMADPLIVEGELPVNLVDKFHPGLPVELIFSAFNMNETPRIAGEVVQVSNDRSIEERTGVPYYKFRVKVTSAGAQKIAKEELKIVAGMSVELFVKTGERTMMNYLLKPIIDRTRVAFSED